MGYGISEPNGDVLDPVPPAEQRETPQKTNVPNVNEKRGWMNLWPWKLGKRIDITFVDEHAITTPHQEET